MTKLSLSWLLVGLFLGALFTIWFTDYAVGSYGSAVNKLNGKTRIVIGWDKSMPEGDIRTDIVYSSLGDYNFEEGAHNGRWDDKIIIKFKNLNDVHEFRNKLLESLKRQGQ